METPFPCPFCRSSWVHLVGGGRRFQHYQCGNCAEVWTAQRMQASAPVNEIAADVPPLPRSKGKVLLN
jgi:transposase-like protein